MSRERETKTNGARIFRDLARDHLDSSKVGIVALGQRVVKPIRATQEHFEDRLRAWEEDVERYARVSRTAVQDTLKPVYLQDLMPEALRGRYDLEKHNLIEYKSLVVWFERMILEYKTQKGSPKPWGLNELEAQSPENPGNPG